MLERLQKADEHVRRLPMAGFGCDCVVTCCLVSNRDVTGEVTAVAHVATIRSSKLFPAFSHQFTAPRAARAPRDDLNAANIDGSGARGVPPPRHSLSPAALLTTSDEKEVV